jgi:hypothetical protein
MMEPPNRQHIQNVVNKICYCNFLAEWIPATATGLCTLGVLDKKELKHTTATGAFRQTWNGGLGPKFFLVFG